MHPIEINKVDCFAAVISTCLSYGMYDFDVPCSRMIYFPFLLYKRNIDTFLNKGG